MSGRKIRNMYNEHIVNKSVVNTYCGIEASSINSEFCGEFQAGNAITDLAIYSLDNAIANNKNINAEQINESAKKIQENIDYTKRLSLSVAGQLKDSGKELIDDLIDAPEAIIDAVYNYDKTWSAIVSLYDNKEEIFDQIGDSLSNSWDKIQNGTPEEQGEAIGKVGFEVAMMFVAPLKAVKGIKLIDKAKDLAEAGEKYVEPIIDSAKKIKLKSKNELTNFNSLAKQVLRADTNTYKYLDQIADSANNVSPTLGNKYVKELPNLDGTFKAAFDGTVHKGAYKPGEVFFQALRTGQDKPGRWFTPVKPIDADHAEELLNINKWGNDAGQLKVFKVKESVSGYAGKVKGGSGHQFFIPNDVPLEDVIEEIILE